MRCVTSFLSQGLFSEDHQRITQLRDEVTANVDKASISQSRWGDGGCRPQPVLSVLSALLLCRLTGSPPKAWAVAVCLLFYQIKHIYPLVFHRRPILYVLTFP
jgi:hypothetical protein